MKSINAIKAEKNMEIIEVREFDGKKIPVIRTHYIGNDREAFYCSFCKAVHKHAMHEREEKEAYHKSHCSIPRFENGYICHCDEARITTEVIRKKLQENKEWMSKALIVLHRAQSPLERVFKEALVLNGVGFTKPDAPILTPLAEACATGRALTEEQWRIAKARLKKYAKQLQQIALAKRAIIA